MEVFFVSTLGQARSAAALIKQLELKAKVFILYTVKNKKVPRAIGSFLEGFYIAYEWFKLPVSPTIPSPLKVRRIKTKYERVLTGIAARRIWISNRNTHYRYIIDYARRNDILIGYFEEGLSSYKEQPNYQYKTVESSFTELVNSLFGYLKKNRKNSVVLFALYWLVLFVERMVMEPITLLRFARYIGERSAIAFFGSVLWEKLLCVYDFKGLRGYFEAVDGFNDSAFVFPDNNRFVNSQNAYKLDLRKSISTDRIDDCRKLLGVEKHCSLYVSQRYGKDSELYYGLIAQSLKKISNKVGLGQVLIKFHPRETEEERSIFLNALESAGVDFTSDPLVDEFSLEEVALTGSFESVIGLTSTSLLYLTEMLPEVSVYSLSDLMLDDVKGKPGFENFEIDSTTLKEFNRVEFVQSTDA